MSKRYTCKLLFLIVVAGSIWLAGCKKSPPAAETFSIVGTWGIDSETQILKTVNAVLVDTGISVGGNALFAITFAADGYYTQYTSAGITGSAYTLYGTALSLYDTSGGTNTWLRYTVPVLTENRLQIVGADTSTTGDTIGQLIYTFTR